MSVTVQYATGRPVTAPNQQTGTSYTLVLADALRSCEFANAGVVTVTVPPNSSVAFPIGARIPARQTGFGGVAFSPGAGVTINSPLGALGILYKYSEAVLEKTATDTWQLAGDIRSAAANLLTKTEQFDNAIWTKSGLTSVTANNTTAPDGNATADRLLEDTSTGLHYVYQTITKAAARTRYTASCYIKGGLGRNLAAIQMFSSGFAASCIGYFDITSGIAQGDAFLSSGMPVDNVKIEDAGGSWVRCSITFGTDTDTALGMLICPILDTLSSSYTGDAAKGLYLWGAQIAAAQDAAIYRVVA